MSARLFDCPQCGAPVPFQSSIAVFAVCGHCQSMVVVRGANVETLGTMAALPPDLSPFHIGTRGEWEGRGFEIVGRVRVEWAEGSWNEWAILYDATKPGWLAEAQGLLMISFEHEANKALPLRLDEYRAGSDITFASGKWTVTDVKAVTYRGAEGELPFIGAAGAGCGSVDLVSTDGRFASITLADGETTLYVGKYAEFEELKFSNLRPVPGWSAEVAQERNKTTAMPCPACGAPVQLRAAGQSMSAVCGSCAGVLDTATPELRLIQEADAKQRALKPVLPIGQRGRLFDTEYEIIGLCARRDQWAAWSEYLLFNPWQGFRWLVTFRGHWSFVMRLPAMRSFPAGGGKFEGRRYQLFAKGKCEVTGVLGEFYWQVRRGEKAELHDYIAPPFILSKEEYPGHQEFAWSHGEYLEARAVAEAFAIKDLPKPEGIYLNQPNRFAQRWHEVKWAFLFTALALIAIHIIFAKAKSEVQIAEARFVHETARPAVVGGTPTPRSTPRFSLTGGEQRVTVAVGANVDNSWLGLDLDLVNAVTNQTFPAALEIGYYHGTDSDGAWSEGDTNGEVSFQAVPPGEYFLTVEPTGDPNVAQIPFTVSVRRGGVFMSNFIVMLLLVLLYPAVLLVRRFRFESSRWAESDYNPSSS